MTTVTFNQQVKYFPGIVPCPNAEITIFDVDQGGNGDDVIFTGRTDSNGVFRGRSRDWEDRNTARNPIQWGPRFIDVPDVLLLNVRVQVNGWDSGRMLYATVPPGVLAPPIVLAIGPPPPPNNLEVDGQPCANEVDFIAKLTNKLSAGAPTVKFTIRGPEASTFDPMTGNANELWQKVKDEVSNQAAPMLDQVHGVVDPATLAAVAVVILAAGAVMVAGILATSVATALVLAVVLGYCNISLKEVPGNAQNPLPGVEFTLSKC